MRKFQGWRAALAGAAVIAGLALPAVAAGPASAANAGGGGHGLRPELITETMSPKTPNGVVNMYGPIRGRDGTDKTVSNTLDVFVFTRGTVTIRHTNVSNVAPKINFRACTATVSATGHWLIPGGTRAYRHAFGFGTFTFREFAVLPRHKNGSCNTNPNAQPVYFALLIVGTGRATNG